MTAADSQLQPPGAHDPLEGTRPDGTITTGAQRGNLSIAFRPVLDRAVEHLVRREGTPSLYVYGSVATGRARVGSSDVDLLSIGLDGAMARCLGALLTAEFAGLSRGVEVAPAQPSDHEGAGDEAYGNRVFLRHYCVHLAGPDPGADLPDCPADRAAARGFNGDIAWHAERWRRAQAADVDPAALGRRIGRKTLLAVAGLVSVHDRTWTTDRVAAAERFGEIRPRLAVSLARLVSWSGGTAEAPSGSDIQAALDGIVTDVVDDFAARIGLWHPEVSTPTG